MSTMEPTSTDTPDDPADLPLKTEKDGTCICAVAKAPPNQYFLRLSLFWVVRKITKMYPPHVCTI